ncbi:hypothetical protein Bca52824_033403 [Brassica carinata]|uniref:Uncharacterized protein n=1 Tax=Brassica carinata TaxID=52824 RepID=A0A8X7SEX6_BRACI|nr:hypothetical protein Bca52824_033403 [Brassica carinata]
MATTSEHGAGMPKSVGVVNPLNFYIWKLPIQEDCTIAVQEDIISSGPFYTYVLADEDGSKMEMTDYGNHDRLRGLENQEGSGWKYFW